MTSKWEATQINDFLDRSYVLHRSSNYDEFLTQLGVVRNTRLQAMKSEPTITLTKVNDEYILISSYSEGRVIKVRFKIGEEMQRRRPAGGATCSVFQVDGNKLIENQQVDGMNVLVEREFKPKDLAVTMEVNGVTCKRWYYLAGSDSLPSYGTETSRRMSLWETESWKSYVEKVEEHAEAPQEMGSDEVSDCI